MMKMWRAICLITVFGMVSIWPLAQTLSVTGDGQINKCETKTYTIVIQNDSGNALTNLVITNDISLLTGFSYVSGTSSIWVDSNPPFCTANPAGGGSSLTWNINTLCSTVLTLNNGQTLNISFNLQTACPAVSGSMNIHAAYDIGGTPSSDDTSYSIQVLPGGVTIKKTPNVISQEIGQNVTWTLTVENTGLGTIKNVKVTDEAGTGLQYVSSIPAGVNVGQTTTWSSTEVPAFSLMNPGDIVTIDITVKTIACTGLDNTADVRWGCDMVTDCFNTKNDGGTATAAVQRIVRTPNTSFTPPDITFTYCTDTSSYSVTINNIGDGTAHDCYMYVDFGPISVASVTPPATYVPGANPYFKLPDIPAGGSYTLEFTLQYNTWCGGPEIAKNLIWIPHYHDDCGNDFYPPVQVSTINPISGGGSLSVSKTGAPAVIQIADQVTYNITSAYSGPLSCGTGSVGTITVVDTVPNGFIVVNSGGGVWVPGGGGTGGTITWYYTPPSSLNVSVILQSPSRLECDTYCHSTFTNTVSASGVDCCGCSMSASASQTSAIECQEIVAVSKTAVPSVAERCTNILYTNTYTFAPSANVNLNDLVFEDEANNQQQYVPGSLSVIFDGNDITACVVVTNGTPGGTLGLNFSGCAATSVNDKVLVIAYDLAITTATAPACSDAAFYSWSNMHIVTEGLECLKDGLIHQVIPVAVQAPAMSLSITGIPRIIDKCDTQTITMTLTRTSTVAGPKDVQLVLSGLNYYVVNPAATVCGGTVAPVSCTPAIVGGDYVWTFNDAFDAVGKYATIQLAVQKRCTGSGDLVATAYFDDRCNDNANPDHICSTTATASPAMLLSGDLIIEKTPEVYYAATNTVQWKVYVTNRGTGTAYNVWVDDVLGSGLDYSSATVDNMTGVTITADQNHSGVTINGVTIAIASMLAGERREITINTLLVNCNNLTNTASTSWGCVGVDCQNVVSDNATVEIPAPLLVNTNVVTTPVDICTSPSGSITVKNAGQTTCYNIQLTETLPTGLLYVSGSTRWRVNGGGWNGPDVAYNPNPTTSPLRWTKTEIPALASINPGDTIEMEFALNASCPFGGGMVTISTQYENPCGKVFTNANSNFAVALRAPVIDLAITRPDQPLGCSESLEWMITVRNRSGYTLPIIWVENTLGAAFTFSSSVGDPPWTSDNGTFDGVNKVAWELRDVHNNDTVTLTLRAQSDSAPCNSNVGNTVRAWWGCGTADGSSATKPGVDPPDNNLCLTTSAVTAVRNETRQPPVGFLNISLSPTQIYSCDDRSDLTVVIDNPGNTDASDIDLVITLPTGLTYITGTSEVCVGTDATCTTALVSDPTVIGNQLHYYDIGNKASNLTDLLQANGGNDTLVLKFSVRSSCYITADLGFRIYYYDCCGDTQYNTYCTETLATLNPNLSVSISPLDSQVACSTQQSWNVTLANLGAAEAEVVRVEVIAGGWIDVNIGASTPGLYDMGGGAYDWEINNLAKDGDPGDTLVFTLVGTLNPDGLPNQNNCTPSLRQLDAAAVWGCGTTGDAVDHDPRTQAYDCTYGTPAFAQTATLQLPDLVVTGITPVISCTGDGTFGGTITAQVQNTGDGNSTGSFTVQVTDGKGWTGTGTYNGTLAAGASVDVTITTTTWTPQCYPCGSPYSFNATVDLNNDICECNETNNTYGPVSYLAPIPNVQVSADTLAVTCTADGQYRVSGTVTLRNAGCTGTLTQDVPMRFTLFSGTGCSGSQLVQWTETFSGVSIAAGSTQTFTITNADIGGNICSSAVGCLVSIRSEADYDNSICECDGTDNTLCSDKTFTIPDLRVDSDTLAISCSADGQIRIQGDLVVANDGCGANFVSNIPIRIRVYNSDSLCSGSNGNVTFTQAGVNIPAGGTQTFAINRTLTRNLCTNSTNCQVSLGVELDYTGIICECNGANNTYCSPGKTVSIPDLQVTGDILGVSCLQDGQVRVSGDVTIANTGCNAAVSGNLPVRFTLFSNINCGGTQIDQWTETFSGANIAAGGSQVFTLTNRDITTDICTNSTSCQVSLRIEVDPTATICECNGANNTRCSNKTVSVPDLRITAVTPSITCTSDGNLSGSVQVTVNNNGCGPAGNIPVRLASDCGYTFTDQTVGSLAAGASTTLNFTFTPNILACTCTFTATADPDNVICECSGSNNSLTAAAYTMNIPNIQVQSDTLGVNCLGDAQVTVSGTVTLRNSGCGSNLTTDIPMRFTLFDNIGCTGNQITQWTQTFTSVNIASGGGTQSFTVTPQNINTNLCANSTSCRFSIRVEADYSNTICESDGTDNTYCADNKPVNIPDLMISAEALTLVCSDEAEATISGSFTLRNNGCGALTQDVPLRLTLYDHAGCTGNQLAQWTQTFTGVNLAAGGGTQVFNITAHVIATNLVTHSTDCKVSIQLEADYTNSICECDGTNNSLCVDKTVNIPNIAVLSDTLAITAIDDGKFQVSGAVTLTNSGCGSNLTANIPVQFTIYDAIGCTGNVVAQWTETLSSTDIVSGGGSQTFTITSHDVVADLCAISPLCAVSILINANFDGSVCESDRTDNTLCTDKNFQIPNLAIISVGDSVPCDGDGNFTGITVTVTNIGCGDATGVVVRLTSDCGLTFTDQTVNLAAGHTETIFFPFTSVITNCNCNFTATIDPDNNICECTSVDNTLSSTDPMTIPDIAVQSDTLSINCAGIGSIMITGNVTLRNSGCGGPLSADIPMRFTLFDNNNCLGNPIEQWTQVFSGVDILSGGGTQVFTVTPHIIATNLCANSSNCQVSILIEADYDQSICEWNGDNNTRCAANKAVTVPDLTVTEVIPTFTCTKTGRLMGTVSVAVANWGCADASQVVVRLTSSCGAVFSDQTVDIPAGTGQTVIFTYFLPCSNCSCTFTASINPDNVICECSNGNNSLTSSSIAITRDISIITVNPPEVIRTTVGQLFCEPCTITGGTPPYSFAKCSASFPPWLTLSCEGMLCGTPQEIGSWSFTIEGWDSNGCDACSKTYTLTVFCDPPVIVEQPTGGVVPGGLPNVLVVSVAGSEPKTYQWYEGETGDTTHPIAGATQPGYATPLINREMRYWVKVKNFCGEASSATIVLTPHFELYGAFATAAGGWNTRLTVVNAGVEAQPITVEALNDIGGRVAIVTTAPLPPATRLDGDLGTVFSQAMLPSSFWVRVSGSTPMAGMLELIPPGSQSRLLVPMVRQGYKTLSFPALADGMWSALALTNPGEAPAEVKLESFTSGGDLLETRVLTLAALNHWAGLANTGRMLKASADQPLIGLALLGQDTILAALPALADAWPLFRYSDRDADVPPDLYLNLLLDPVAYDTELSIFNLVGIVNPAWGEIRDGNGQPLSETEWAMAPHSTLTGFLPSSPAQGKELKIGASRPEAAYSLSISRAHPGLLVALPIEPLSGRRLCFPVVGALPSLASRLALSAFVDNPLEPATVTLTAYDASGATVGTLVRTMTAGPHLEIDLAEAFPGVTSIAWLQAAARQPLIGTLLIIPSDSLKLVCYNGIAVE